MLHPSYTDLMRTVNKDAEEEGTSKPINSRYSIVLATAKRARQLIAGAETLVETDKKDKPLSITVKEMASGELKIISSEEE